MLTEHKLDSTVVDTMRYDPVEQEMIVTFRTGKTYRFREVPNQVYSGMLAAESPGRFVHQVLRTYGGEQVLAEEPEVKEEDDAVQL